MTQIFIGLENEPFACVLGIPNEKEVPDIENIKCFIIDPGNGVMIHKGTWHDFPMSLGNPVTIFTMNSREVVKALEDQKEAGEMNTGDVFKINVHKRTGVNLFVNL